ncbi:MAG TPA: amino acid adenylation domain-containing protein, partial [Kofleriaceae bacterium]|nr:amino acid adenylation domain-containing protein [Kofleriaceae bacterium]
FNLLNFPAPRVALEDLTFEALAHPDTPSKFDLTVYAAEGDGRLGLDLVYNADLFDRARIEELAEQYQLLLEQCADDPDRPVAQASLVSAPARRVLPDPAEPLDPSWPGAIQDHLSRQAARVPARIAIADVRGSWTYAELEAASNRLARHLSGRGVGRRGEDGPVSDVIAIWAHRSAPLVWAIMAGLKTGAAVLVLDPAYPGESLVQRLALASPGALLRLPGAAPIDAAVREWLQRHPRCAVVELPSRPGPSDAWARESDAPPAVSVGPGDAALLSFTSGSTGVPKGIVCLHRSLTHFVPWQREEFELEEDDRFSMLSGLSHDPLQRDIFTALQLGAAICVPDPERMSEPGYLAGWAAQARVSVAHLTPAMAQLLAETPAGSAVRVDSLRRAFVVGDVLTRRDVDRVRRIAPGVVAVNFYGSTETQRAVGYHVVEPGPSPRKQALPLGRGMRDVQLLVVNAAGNLAGVGEVGEILVRSPHLAGGYLADAEQTRRKFTASPFSGDEEDRVYRTGDMGRYLPDGEVEWAGRADRQVKVRGFRIELGEIEAALARHPGVADVAVVAVPVGGEGQLVAYLVRRGGAELDVEELRAGAARVLPDYMMPAAIVLLERMPLTPTGKLDRAALPPPPPRVGRRQAPHTSIQEALAAIWSGLLGIDQVSLEDDFFALGGHSLRATQLVSRVHSTLGVELPVRAVFEAPTLGALAERVEAAQGVTAPPLVAVPRDGPLPLSFSQERLWFLAQMDPGSPLYNIPVALRLTGSLNAPALARALAEVVRRHEVLRTRFEDEGGVARQVAVPFEEAGFALDFDDLIALPAEQREAEAMRGVEKLTRQSFDLATGPLLRARLVRMGQTDHLLILVVHHAVSDAWSMGVLVGEAAALYRAFADGVDSPLPALPVQYADFARWQRAWLEGDALERQLAYWRGRLAGCAPLELPADRPRPARSSSRGERLAFVLPGELRGELEQLGQREGATLFMTLLAGFAGLLQRYSGQDDLCVGTPVAGRSRIETEPLIGFFVNTLVLRADLSGDPSFRQLLARVRDTALGAYANQDVPFERLVEELAPRRDLGRQPLFQAMFVLQNAPMPELVAPGLSLAPVPVDTATSKFDLTLTLVPRPEGGLWAAFEYASDLFDRDRVARMAEHFRALLEAIARDPAERVSRLSMLGQPERDRITGWSGGRTSYAASRTLDQLFAEQVA